MSNVDTSWKVLAHDPIVKLSDNLWWVSGALPHMTLKRTMTVVRLGGGDLVVHNPIALEEPAMRELDAWGKIAWLVVPNGMHRLDAPRYKARYPSAKVLTPPGARQKVEEQLTVDATTDASPIADDAVRFEALQGVKDAESAMIVRSGDGVSVVLTDVMFNMDKKQDFLGWAIATAFGSAPGPRVSRLAKLLLIRDQSALRGDFERLANLPQLTRVIVAHEKVAAGPDAKAALLTAATYL